MGTALLAFADCDGVFIDSIRRGRVALVRLSVSLADFGLVGISGSLFAVLPGSYLTTAILLLLSIYIQHNQLISMDIGQGQCLELKACKLNCNLPVVVAFRSPLGFFILFVL